MVSIIVITYSIEREPDIKDLLASLRDQTFRDFEVIVVVEKSRDLPARLLEYAGMIELTNLRVLVNDAEPGPAPSYNIGVASSSGTIVAFLDDDTVAFPDWLEAVVATFQDQSVIGMSGAALPRWEARGLEWYPRELYWMLSCSDWLGASGTVDIRTAWGNNMAFRREVFAATEGFRSELSRRDQTAERSRFSVVTSTESKRRHDLKRILLSEDAEFSLRVRRATGGRIVFNSVAKVWHKVPTYKTTVSYAGIVGFHLGVSRYIIRRLQGREFRHYSMESIAVRSLLGLLMLRVPFELLRSPTRGLRILAVAVVSPLFAVAGYAFAVFRWGTRNGLGTV
jgi:GT2 family glycosyltransferase